MFNTSIQIRILKQVVAAERQRQADAAALLDSISHNVQGSHSIPIESSAYARAISPAPSNHLLLTIEPDTTEGHDDSWHILAQLQAVTACQNERDIVYDTADLRQLMRTALQANNDGEMILVLQVGRDEMPEAIKMLQRALEKEVERESLEEEAVLVSANVAAVESATVHSTESSGTTSGSVASSAGRSSRAPRDTLDREFIETGIDALRRLSRAEVTLLSWTITRYEVKRNEKIGMGFFSDVYKGTWRNHVVAIKVLAPTTPRQLFVHQVSIWKTLQHLNVCELLGASSASSDPPWFFVSPYYKNGSLVTYLKGLPSLDNVDLLKMVHEIAKGMSYLHSQGVLHGDLKAPNVLVNDKHHCIISDFGQSEMKSEAYRVSGRPLPHGTLRWQAPELMSAQSGLTQEIDVVQIGHDFVGENMRPELPLQRVWSQQLSEILHSCWHCDSTMRPPFFKIDKDVQRLKESPASRHLGLEQMKTRKSPDMHPIPLSLLPDEVTASFVEVGSAPSTDVSFMTAIELESVTGHSHDYHDDHRDHKGPDTDLSRTSSRASLQDSQSSEHIEFPRHVSPPPDERAQNIRDERWYRMLLQYEFHPSLTLPLWMPSQVLIGAVGYHSKANYGEFVTLFSSFEPEKSSNGRVKNIPSLYGYGRVSQGSQRQDKRNVAQRGMDLIQSWLGPRNRAGEATYSRRYSSPLRSGHKAANLFTESMVYRYMEDPVTSKKWFKARTTSW
ncbi:kinase-like protein [Dichomitus squalens LYAD-421 SS1]|uniref:Kinase-like protein n=1 Tax=Dichomitus squalens (strain LYAD-421) TaxID=732165 RepID=R7SKB5_DICSQ|nr:kinase-like protein [Dichomitus squalens LYAD-421 SS1]EJF55497.1 kinase-like protein [Dichomitus squalens LYAD-421 SS1]